MWIDITQIINRIILIRSYYGGRGYRYFYLRVWNKTYYSNFVESVSELEGAIVPSIAKPFEPDLLCINRLLKRKRRTRSDGNCCATQIAGSVGVRCAAARSMGEFIKTMSIKCIKPAAGNCNCLGKDQETLKCFRLNARSK